MTRIEAKATPPVTAAQTPTGSGKLKRDGDKIETDRYDIVFEKDRVRVTDRRTNTDVQVWGDPHVTTSDGDKASFTRDNLTLDLEDGTKITITPTPEENGVAFIGDVAIINGNKGIVVKGVHDDAGPQFGRVGNAARIDARYEDGTVLRARGEVNDLVFAATGEELVGTAADAPNGEFDLDGRGGVSIYNYAEELEVLTTNGAKPRDFYERLISVLAKLDKAMERILDELDSLAQETAKPDPSAGDPGQVKTPEDTTGAAKGAGKSGSDTKESVESKRQRLTFRLQQLQNERSELVTRISQIMDSNHQTNMAILRNIRS